jgi:outer membrane protein OmpA-like peptidoglycan-associated protein
MAAHSKTRAGVLSGPLHSFVALPITLLALGVLTVGCATKGYVKQRVAESEARTDASINVVKSDLAETRTIADQAMEKATLAEKLATGAIDYTVVSTHDAHFAFDDFRLDSESMSVLDNMVSSLSSRPRTVVEIRGYADAQGEDHYNYRLGRERAESVERYLVSRHSIPPARIAVMSFGEDDPVSDNTSDSGRAMNRRVTARVLELTAKPGETPVAANPEQQ